METPVLGCVGSLLEGDGAVYNGSDGLHRTGFPQQPPGQLLFGAEGSELFNGRGVEETQSDSLGVLPNQRVPCWVPLQMR